MITPLPPLSRTDPDFKAKVNEYFLDDIPNLTVELNVETARISALEFGSYVATSTTSNTVTTGSKAFTVELNKGFVAGQFIVAASTASPLNYLLGQVTSYNKLTGQLVMNATSVGGSGTFTTWSISVASAPMESGIQQFLFINQGVI